MNCDDDNEVYKIPRRKNGDEKAFWYDPAYPRHIMQRCPGYIRTICVGHQD